MEITNNFDLMKKIDTTNLPGTFDGNLANTKYITSNHRKTGVNGVWM